MHEVICGETTGGKTFLACEKARDFMRAGINVLVFDPRMDNWPCTWQTTSLDDFLSAAKKSRRCALFVDDAGESVARNKKAEWLFTIARHWGHLTHVLCQGGPQLLPTMRSQCSRLYLFGVGPPVADFWAYEFNEPGLSAAVSLPDYSFLVKTRRKPLLGPFKVPPP